ncbi:MAG: M20/M25/M40 family metallo-hydrolase [Thermoplasmata archaeon]
MAGPEASPPSPAEEQEAGRRLRRLLEAYSPSGAEAEAVRAFVAIAGELGYAAEVDPDGNGIARMGSGRPQVLFLGHIDTVPGALPVREVGGTLTGRGACDAKGPLVAALLAGAEGRLPAGELVVVAAVGEETDSRGTRGLLPRWRPDAVIAGEPSGWSSVAIGYKGDLRVRGRFDGERQHLSAAEPSAAERVIAWARAVRGLADEAAEGNRFRRRTGKIVSVRAEEDGAGAEAVVDLRIPPGETAGELEAAVRAIPGPASVEVIAAIDPFETDRDDPVVRALVDGIRRAGATPTLYRKGGTSDLNLAAPAWGLGGAAYGPGDPHLDHTDREAIELAELARSVRVLRSAFAALVLGGPRPTPRRSAPGS